VSRGAPIPWLLCSPGLTPLDFFFGGFVKDVYCEKVQNVNELHDIRTVDCITSEMLASTWQETKYYLEVCCSSKGYPY